MGVIKTEKEQIEHANIAAKIVENYPGVGSVFEDCRVRKNVEAKMIYVMLCSMMRLDEKIIGESYQRGHPSVFKHRLAAMSLANNDKFFERRLTDCEELLIKHFGGEVPMVKRVQGMNDKRFYPLYMQLCENIPDGYETFFEVKILEYINSLKEEIGLNGRIKIRPYKLRDERVARFNELAIRELD